MVKRYGIIEEIIRTDEQGEKIQEQDFASPIYNRVQNVLPRVLAYLVIFSEKSSGTKYPKVLKNVNANH